MFNRWLPLRLFAPPGEAAQGPTPGSDNRIKGASVFSVVPGDRAGFRAHSHCASDEKVNKLHG